MACGMPSITRRHVVAALGGVTAIALAWAMRLGQAQRSVSIDEAKAFIKQAGDKLVAVLSGPYGEQEKRRQLRLLISTNVDIHGIARFAMGSSWRSATASQREDFVRLFPTVLIECLTEAIGTYPGVSFTVGRAVENEDCIEVWTGIFIPDAAPRSVGWVVCTTADGPRIVDVVALGMSLRITQRDYIATLVAQHGSSIEAMISALRHDIGED